MVGYEGGLGCVLGYLQSEDGLRIQQSGSADVWEKRRFYLVVYGC